MNKQNKDEAFFASRLTTANEEIAEWQKFAQQVIDMDSPKDILSARTKASMLLTRRKVE